MSKYSSFIIHHSSFLILPKLVKNYISLSLSLSLLCVVVLATIAACGKNNDTSGSNRLVATVYNRSLYLTDLDGMFPESATHQDSQQVITAFSDRWIREQVIMSEAERNVPKELNLDELVKKYRESLILSNYEEQLTKIGLDTAITEGELTEFYEKNKEQYQLETPIVRCYFLKVARPTQQIDSLNKWWNSPKSGDNLSKLQVYAQQNAKNYIFEDSIWTRADDIIAMLPKGTLTADNISTGKELTLKTDDAQYFFRALGVMNKQEIAPLSFIRSQASKYILHRRKTQLLEKKKQEMYDTELRKNNVKIYSY
jgi:hypothetical protein